MELASPHHPASAVLVLGVEPVQWSDLDRICQDAGLVADYARDLPAALQAFLRRGGHEVIACIGDPTPQVAAIVDALRTIDPELPLLRLPTAAELTASDLAFSART